MIRVVPPAEQTTRNAFRRRMSGWRYTTIPSLRILCCSVGRGTFSRAAAPRGPDRRPPVRRNASRIWARSFSSRLGRSVSFPLEDACSGISAGADSERSCAGFAVWPEMLSHSCSVSRTNASVTAPSRECSKSLLTTLRNSRILPGQSWLQSAPRTLADRCGGSINHDLENCLI